MSDDDVERDEDTLEMFDASPGKAGKVAKIDRKSRDSEERTATERPRVWRPVSRMPDPQPRDGWKHRYVRRSMHGIVDSVNVSRYLQEGWEFCRPADYPEFGDALALGRPEGNQDMVEFGGMVLMRIPEELLEQRDAHYSERARRQIAGVNERLNASATDARLRVDNQSKSTVKKSPY